MIKFNYTTGFVLQNEKPINKLIAFLSSKEGVPISKLLYHFVSKTKITEINKTHLSHNYSTDVITFDYCEGNSVSGDIFISIERVKENSEVFKVDFLTELNRVMVHGLLHLLGYKDKTERESNLMRKKENYYLSKY